MLPDIVFAISSGRTVAEIVTLAASAILFSYLAKKVLYGFELIIGHCIDDSVECMFLVLA